MNDTDRNPSVRDAVETKSGNTVNAEKQCPECIQLSAPDATHCWACNHDFTMGTRANDTAVAEAPLPVLVEGPMVANEEKSGTAAAPVATPVGVAAPNVVLMAPVFAGSQPPMHQGDETSLGEAGDEIFAEITRSPAGAAGSSAGVETASAASVGKTPKLGVEPSAISIPELDIEHPQCAHAVLVVDQEFRRSREGKALTPPDPRPPVLILLTEEGHQFGRHVQSFSLDFDPATSGIHGAFLKTEDGSSYSLVDMNSNNGTKLNGKYVEPGLPVPLRDMAVITLGLWTKIIFYAGSVSKPVASATAS
jgi:hypothetical protein